MTKDMIKHARTGNLVKFERAFKAVIQERIPAAIDNERKRIADLMFNPKSDQ